MSITSEVQLEVRQDCYILNDQESRVQPTFY